MQEKADENKKRSFLKVFMAVALICAVAVAVVVNYTFIADSILAIGYEPSAELQSIINAVQLTDAGSHIAMATRPQLQDSADFNEACPNSNENASILGCYGENKVFIYNVTNDELDGIHEATFAHELLHAVWDRMAPWDRTALEKSIDQVYSENSGLREHMQLYDDNSKYDELHSVIGSQISCEKMPSDLCRHYQKYFQSQDKVARYYEKYSQKFAALSERAELLERQIEEYRTKIQKLQEEYDQKGATLSGDINIFNARARTGYFKTVDEFEKAHSAIMARRTALEADYNSLVETINSANQLIEEYNTNITRSNELQRSIDSKAAQPQPSTVEHN